MAFGHVLTEQTAVESSDNLDFRFESQNFTTLEDRYLFEASDEASQSIMILDKANVTLSSDNTSANFDPA